MTFWDHVPVTPPAVGIAVPCVVVFVVLLTLMLDAARQWVRMGIAGVRVHWLGWPWPQTWPPMRPEYAPPIRPEAAFSAVLWTLFLFALGAGFTALVVAQQVAAIWMAG